MYTLAQMTGFYKSGNETSESIKAENFLTIWATIRLTINSTRGVS
jgi:hypothetical protein